MNQAENNFDAIVVGAGISGLLSALALAKEGKQVLVVEKDNFVGGNCRTYKLNGYSIDTGPHCLTEIKSGPLAYLMEKYFLVVPKFLPINNYYARDGKKFQEIPVTLPQFALFSILSRKDRVLVIGAMMDAIAFYSIHKKFLAKSVYDYIKKYRLSAKTLKLIDAVCYFLSGKSMKETPMWRILSGSGYVSEVRRNNHIEKIIKLIRNDYDEQGYPAGGIQSITKCVMDSLPEKAVTFNLGEALVKFIVAGGKITGVRTVRGEYRAPLVVYSGFVKELPDFTDDLENNYAESLKKIKQTQSFTLWLGLKKRLPELSYVGSEVYFNTDTPYWAVPVSNFDSSLAPAGRQLVGFSTTLKENSPAKQLKKLKHTIRKAIPSIKGNIEFEHVQVTVPEKAAVTVGVEFPSPRSPIGGLYLVGTDTDTRSMGLTRASYSVVEMLKFMKEDGAI